MYYLYPKQIGSYLSLFRGVRKTVKEKSFQMSQNITLWGWGFS